MPNLCPHDRLRAHCMWCLADALGVERDTLIVKADTLIEETRMSPMSDTPRDV